MASSIPSGNYSQSLHPASTRGLRPQGVVPSEGGQAALRGESVAGELAPSRALPSPEQVRRIEAQAEAKSVVLQRFRSPDELPKFAQDALATYRETLAASLPGENGELVSLDLYV